MKKIKIYALPSHQTKERTSGVDFARIIQPIKHLNGWKNEEIEFETTIYDIHAEEQADWGTIAKEYDVIYLNYIANPWAFAAMGAMARRYGTKIVLDVDDALWNIRSDNPAYDCYKKGTQEIKDFTSICNEVDYMTTTNSYLKHVIMNNTKKKANEILVFPNYIDLDFYKHRGEFRDENQIRLTHFGSTTHFMDLSDEEFFKGIDKIMMEYPQVVFQCVGAFMPQFRKKWGARFEQAFGHSDIYRWVEDKDLFAKFMDDTDILVVPLDEDIYNKSKSNIKYLEASSAKKPGIYQNIRQYSEIIKHGENGYLASKATDWYKAIKELIDDKKKRQEMGKMAFKTVSDNHQIQSHITDYANFFASLV